MTGWTYISTLLLFVVAKGRCYLTSLGCFSDAFAAAACWACRMRPVGKQTAQVTVWRRAC